MYRSNVGSTVIHQSGWSPITEWTQPFTPEFSSETYYAQSHVIGNLAAPRQVSSIQAQSYASDGWISACGGFGFQTYNSNPGRWSSSTPGCDQFESWTQ